MKIRNGLNHLIRPQMIAKGWHRLSQIPTAIQVKFSSKPKRNWKSSGQNIVATVLSCVFCIFIVGVMIVCIYYVFWWVNKIIIIEITIFVFLDSLLHKGSIFIQGTFNVSQRTFKNRTEWSTRPWWTFNRFKLYLSECLKLLSALHKLLSAL